MGLFDKFRKPTGKATSAPPTMQVTDEQRARDAARNEARKEADAMTLWFNVSERRWLVESDDERLEFFDVDVVAEEVSGKSPMYVGVCNGARLFEVTSRMGAYEDVGQRVGSRVDHLIVEAREKDGRPYYRIGLVYWPKR